ncbi:hypothetical protein [Niallia nealsonii]|uniref:Uncharacterized protein n=1 Tax=Niallia nealsonii TaxID=115979 RepID=A0A2N0Z0U3_9BACI|nr:hypothetical protein [Niallia nealsonii]PKG23134.1 hypothetical protein CWS01_13780 [Niallia nealsonii]
MGKKFMVIIIFAVLAAVLVFRFCSSQGEPPEAFIKINGKDITMKRGSYQWTSRYLLSYSTEIADAASPNQIAENMEAVGIKQKSVGDIAFHDDSNPKIHAYIWSGTERSKELTIKNNKLTLPAELGKHVIEVETKWKKGNASYTFVVDIQ